jgi:hypothetical protein
MPGAFGLITRQKAAAAIVDPATFGTTLALIAHDEWGTEWLEWHPDTVLREFADTWRVPLHNAFPRLMAAALILSTDRFYKEEQAFRICCSALSGGHPSAEISEPPDALACAWGIVEALHLDDCQPDPSPFSEEVRRYLGAVLAHEHMDNPPDVLRVAIMPPIKRHPLPEDPDLVSAARQVAEIRNREITDSIRSGLERLVAQRKALGLSDADSRASDLKSK